jgi:putative DNA methylase
MLFAQLVDDPSSHPDTFPTPEAQDDERKRLFAIIEDLVKWENSTNEEVLERARAEIRASCGGEVPPIYDPFSGGGSIPLEAQRLGLPAYGSDLNPVAVMIGKAMIEIPPKFKDMEPVHPGMKERNHYRNAAGLVEDVKYYGEWMREKALERIGHLYPQVDLPRDYGGGKATVIAWIWARTVPSPDPAFSDAQVPLAASFLLSGKKGKESWLEPIVDKLSKRVTFKICKGQSRADIKKAKIGTKVGRANFRCLLSDAAIDAAYIRRCANKGDMGAQLIAIVAEGKSGRVYLPGSDDQQMLALSANPSWKPEGLVPTPSHDVDRLPMYGMPTWGDAFSDRQLVALSTLSELLVEVRNMVRLQPARNFPEDHRGLEDDGCGITAYAEAVSVYLGFLIGQLANHSSTVCGWNSPNQQMRSTFSRQAIPMTWDYAEVNIFSTSSGSFHSLFERLVKGLETLGASSTRSRISQSDAQRHEYDKKYVFSTDPPYYDNISYSDVSDFFYSWMRPALRDVYPSLFGTLTTPKSEELIASPDRHGGRGSAEAFFLAGMSEAIRNMARNCNEDYPTAIYYAFKQSDIESEGVSSTGWATFIAAVLSAGFSVLGTWPVRTEKPGRMVSVGTNALANSVVLVCRKREAEAGSITRAEFIRALKRELPPSIKELQDANVSPADMPQSAIGPGMGVFSRYQAVLESDDSPMNVKAALQLINTELDEYLGGIQGEFDADTRFAISWFEQNGLKAGDFGAANSIATARGISVESVKHAGIVESQAGKVRILKRDELDPDWEPQTDTHLTVWECLQYLVRAHEKDGISYNTALLLRKIDDKAEAVKDLAYCLYDICANKRQDAKEATAYNALIADWSDLTREAAAIVDIRGTGQTRMDF